MTWAYALLSDTAYSLQLSHFQYNLDFIKSTNFSLPCQWHINTILRD